MNTMPTKFIYLRNNIYVERLSEGEIQIFLAAIDNNRAVINDELIAIVKRNMSKVLRCVNVSDDNQSVRYGAPVPGPYEKRVNNNSLLFEISCRLEYKDDGWRLTDISEANKELLLNDTIPMIQKEFSNYKDMPIIFTIGNGIDYS